ncbi:uncharacterized protein LOC133199426 [Saccostrea echinata]|uniref:uncharacterized protein LOC133199426 n=1 Tax=Saccostrea echinata TaxID=191078 RepID=UPI002A808410|nr:uncharacterized protein LOC133199426 [Saccostrea echinata]
MASWLLCSLLTLTLSTRVVHLLRPVDEYPFYLNSRECEDMFPESLAEDATNAQMLKSQEPFDIEFNPAEYDKSSVINVKVFTKKFFQSDYPIRGALLQARIANCQDKDHQKAIGIFQQGQKAPFLHTVKCANSLANGVAIGVIKEGKDGLLQVAIDWTPPSEQENRTLYFVATVLSTNGTFFTDIISDFLIHHSQKDSPPKAEHCEMRKLLQKSGSSRTRGPEISLLSVVSVLLFLIVVYS